VEVGRGQGPPGAALLRLAGLSKVPPVAERPRDTRKGCGRNRSAEYSGDLRAVTVLLDHRLSVHVALNGKEALAAHCALDVNQHQLAYSGEEGAIRGRLLPLAIEAATVRGGRFRPLPADAGFWRDHHTTRYAELSPEGQRVWWRKLAEYNLLLHRDTHRRPPERNDELGPPADASPHYYGDNFPNCEPATSSTSPGAAGWAGK